MKKRSRKEILHLALKLRDSGELYDRSDSYVDNNVFKGSVDRFTLIAEEFVGRKRVLDIGSGNGVLVSLLSSLGHECYGTDFADCSAMYPVQYKNVYDYRVSNVEVEKLPYEDNFFDAICCCQVLEHFTHSPLFAMKEMLRILKPGGVLEIDVPNMASFRNRSRMLRGKNVLQDFKKKYIYAEPVLYKGMSFFPDRHNHEYTKAELNILFQESGFKDYKTTFLKSRRHRTGLEKFKNIGTALKDSVPSFRKSLIGFAYK